MRSSSGSPVAERVKDYAKIGLWIGLGLSTYALCLFLIRGTKPFDALGMSVIEVCLGYFVGGTLGGAIYGVLEPITSTFVGSVIAGTLTAAPFCILIALTFIPEEKLASQLIPFSLSISLFWGIFGSVIAWFDRSR
jgi:ABC-type phosphate transport system permease subunit